MSVGKLRTFDEFGWLVSQSASVQRANVQSAFDSGERLLMPVGDTVQIDAPLVFNHPTELSGAGGDITDTATAASQFRCGVSGVQMLQIRSNHVRLSGFNLHADAPNIEGIVIGDGTTTRRGVVLEDMTTAATLTRGVRFLSGANCTIRGGSIMGSDAALMIENQHNADEGDNIVQGAKFYSPSGIGLKWLSGGGLYMGQSKFDGCANHVYVDWSSSGSGGFVAVGNSFETCIGISVDLRGEFPFERMMFVGNTWGVPSVAIAARNFCATNWLKQLEISSNTIKVMGRVPALDLGCTDNASVFSNSIDGTGVATAGIITRNGTGAIGINRIVGCANQHFNYASWSMTSAGQL